VSIVIYSLLSMTVNAWELFATHHVYLHRLYNRRKPGAIGFCAHERKN
jgi:hypothetical protein